jgi:hypothetical protein
MQVVLLVRTAAVAHQLLQQAMHSGFAVLDAEHHKIQLMYCAISPIRTRNNIASGKQVYVGSSFALPFWKL